jgi:Mg-chelatase subunit ChlD
MVAPERYQDAPAHGPVGLPRRATRTRAPDVSVELMVRGDGEVEGLRSPSHKIHLRHTDDGVPIAALDAGEALPNKDFVLTWRAGDVGVRPWLRFERDEGRPGTFLLMLTPSVPRTHTEGVGGDGDAKAVRCGNCGGVIRDLSAIKEIPGLGPVIPCAFCGAILAPGTEVITRATRPRDVLILVDRSASMRGAMPAAARAVRALLDGMGPGDGAQLMAFDHDRLAFDGDGERFAVISPELTQMADRFMATLTPRGGTELDEALARASKAPAREGRTRVVVLITDAAVGNEGRLLRRVPELLGASTRLFVLGLGPAVDRRLVERLARAGGGASDVALPGDTDPEVFPRFARKVREGGAVLTNVTLYWEGAEMVDVYPKRVPDLHGGEPLKVFGRFTHTGMTKLIITAATADGKPYRQEVEVGLPASTTRKPGITRLWARQRVEDLAARAAAGATDAGDLRAEGTALALAHSLVGPFTSLVAEDLEVSVQKRQVRKTRLLVSSVNVPMTGLTVERARVTIGRGSGADLQLLDTNVSRMHCELVLNDDAWEVRDLNSVNGTWVNGKNLRQGRIEPGSTLKVGDTTLRFEFADGFFETLPTKRVDVPPMPVDRGAPEAEGGGGLSVSEKAAQWRARTAARAESAAAMTDELLADEESEGEAMERDLDLSVPHAAAPRAAAPVPRAFGPIGASRGGGPMFGSAPMSAAAPKPVLSPSLMRDPAAPMTAAAPMPAPGAPLPGAPMPAPMYAPMPAPGAPPPSFGAAPPPAARSESAYAPPPPAPGMIGAFGPPPSAFVPPPAKRGGGVFSRIVDAFTGGGGEASDAPPTKPAPMTPPPMMPPPNLMAPPPPMMPPPNLMAPPPPMNLPPPPRPTASPLLKRCERCGHMNETSVVICTSCGGFFGPPGSVEKPLQQKGFVASEPYSDEELAWFRARNRGELDLVFLVDETGSMGSYIAQVREHLLALVEELKSSPLCRMLRVGVVSYRDHPPQDRTYASKVLPLTDDIETVRRAVEKLTASGGGDGPESVTDGLYDLVRLDWRSSAARAVVWFGDAPPHGVEPHGDAFPEGCPCGHHWFTQAESCREMGVTVYAIGCLPGIRAFKGAEAVFQQVARTTHGVYLPLREASLLVPMIVGAASAELDRQRVDEHVSDLVTEAGVSFVDTTDVERVSWLSRALTAKGVRLRDMQLDEGANAAPLRFRAVVPADVEASLQRLRYQGRVSA